MAPLFLALAPLLIFVLVLFWKKTPLIRVSFLALLLTTVLAVVYWQMFPAALGSSYAKGIFIALDIFFIILGAIFFLEILKHLKIIESLSFYLESFSRDYRIQVIILAWFFENFLEGTAGFGTPATVVAPLLVGLGISPITAVVLALIGNSTAGVFGAAGTPIRVGLAGLNTASVPIIAVLINCIGFIVPIFMLAVLVAGKKDRVQQFLEALPFAIWSGIAFVIPSVLTVFLGQEFPSILGSVIGLILVFITTRLGIFVPQNIRPIHNTQQPLHRLSFFKSAFPYGLLIALLILGKIFLGSSAVTLGIGHKFNLFNPGFAFIIAGFLTALIWGRTGGVSWRAVKTAAVKTIEPFMVIVFMSAMVQIMINSGQNPTGLPSAISLIAKNFETTWLGFWAPFVGAFGSFITGSVTISNIMFGNFLNFAAQTIGINAPLVLSLAITGAAAGNMIALADILVATTVVGLHHEERQVLKGAFIPCLIYLLLIGLIGLIII